MTFPHGLFENLDCSRKLLLLLLLLIGQELIVKRSSSLAARNHVDGDYQETFCEGKEGEQRSSVISGMKDNFRVGASQPSFLTPLLSL
jgi:hypothetical protein